MPKRSQKSKSKRMSLKQKYKIIKKVKEHHKKKKKEMKGKKAPKVKDPGLPSQWPFKEELVKEFAFKRAQILAEEKRKKDARRQLREASSGRAPEEMDADGAGAMAMAMAKIQASAQNKQADFETRKRARLTEDFKSDKDNSRKAFFKEFKKVVELADVIIQVLDARDPAACRAPDVERYIRSTNPDKKIILLLNKMDLVPREVGEKWLKYFREELPTVAFKCATQQQATNLKRGRGMPAAKTSGEGLAGSGCLGADTLLQLLKNYTRNAGIKTAITVGVVGMPNVGKSSLINSLKRARVAQVGNTPGVTKAVQEVHLDKNIKLLDSPGVVFANADTDAAAVLRNATKVERLADPLPPVAEILKRVPAKQLMALYRIQAFKTSEEFLQLIAASRGKLRRGGVPDMVAAARIVLQDWADGRIPYYTLPPSRGNEEFAQAEVVAQWAKEFNADEVFAAEQSAVIVHLPSMEGDSAVKDGGRQFFEAPSAGAVSMDLASMEAEVAADAARGEEEEDGSDGMDDDDEEDDDEEDDEDASGSGRSDDEDAMDDADGEDAVLAAAVAQQRQKTAKAGAAKATAASQNAALYDEQGQYNPHAARAAKKQQKKKQRLSGGNAEGDDIEYDFNEFQAKEVAAKQKQKGAKAPAKGSSAMEASEDEEGDEEGSEEEEGSD